MPCCEEGGGELDVPTKAVDVFMKVTTGTLLKGCFQITQIKLLNEI